MEQQRICEDCYQKHDCKEIYRQLGNVKGQSITVKVILAFLLPLVIFIATMAIFEEFTAGVIESDRLQMTLSFFTALMASFACVLFSRFLNRKIGKNR